MRTLLALLFAAMLGVSFVGSTFAADAAKPPQATTAIKAADTKAEKKQTKHHKAAAKSHMKKEEKKM